MLLALQVILTIQAWRKGWRFLALLPVGTVLFLVYSLTSIMTDFDNLFVPALCLDLLCVGALSTMVNRAPQSAPTLTPSHVS